MDDANNPAISCAHGGLSPALPKQAIGASSASRRRFDCANKAPATEAKALGSGFRAVRGAGMTKDCLQVTVRVRTVTRPSERYALGLRPPPPGGRGKRSAECAVAMLVLLA
jgi:hypothetical protein